MPKSKCLAALSRHLHSFWTAALLSATLSGGHSAAAAEARDWIFLDFGETVVTGAPNQGYRYVAGILDYLHTLREKGYKIGLITNIPQSWGTHCTEKLAALQEHVRTYLIESPSFDWTLFDRVVLAPFDRYRKPHPYMFLQALQEACPGRAMYIGDDLQETEAARKLGFAAYFGAEGSGDRPPIDQLAGMVARGFHFVHPEDCDLAPHITEVLFDRDDPSTVSACNLEPHN